MELPNLIGNVVAELRRLPGVGEKSALRHVLAMTTWDEKFLNNLGDGIKNLAYLKKCQKCNLFSDGELCNICSSPERGKAATICIVENAVDCLAIEKSGHYRGRFHVLGGVLNPLMGVGPDELNIDKMVSRILEECVQEIILAINPSVEGDATCSYIRMRLPQNVVVERIGLGIPMGGSLEYVDPLTISKALENRKRM